MRTAPVISYIYFCALFELKPVLASSSFKHYLIKCLIHVSKNVISTCYHHNRQYRTVYFSEWCYSIIQPVCRCFASREPRVSVTLHFWLWSSLKAKCVIKRGVVLQKISGASLYGIHAAKLQCNQSGISDSNALFNEVGFNRSKLLLVLPRKVYLPDLI